jgi:hypothetical protein
MGRRARPEDSIQRSVIEHLRWRGVKGLVFLHPANGFYRTKAEAGIAKAMGVVAGAPDLLLWLDGKSYAIELKSAAGRISDAQIDMLDRLSEAGVFTAIAHGLDRALAILEAWQLLKGTPR